MRHLVFNEQFLQKREIQAPSTVPHFLNQCVSFGLTFFSDSIHLLMAGREEPVRSLRANKHSVTIARVVMTILCEMI